MQINFYYNRLLKLKKNQQTEHLNTSSKYRYIYNGLIGKAISTFRKNKITKFSERHKSVKKLSLKYALL